MREDIKECANAVMNGFNVTLSQSNDFGSSFSFKKDDRHVWKASAHKWCSAKLNIYDCFVEHKYFDKLIDALKNADTCSYLSFSQSIDIEYRRVHLSVEDIKKLPFPIRLGDNASHYHEIVLIKEDFCVVEEYFQNDFKGFSTLKLKNVSDAYTFPSKEKKERYYFASWQEGKNIRNTTFLYIDSDGPVNEINSLRNKPYNIEYHEITI